MSPNAGHHMRLPIQAMSHRTRTKDHPIRKMASVFFTAGRIILVGALFLQWQLSSAVALEFISSIFGNNNNSDKFYVVSEYDKERCDKIIQGSAAQLVDEETLITSRLFIQIECQSRSTPPKIVNIYHKPTRVIVYKVKNGKNIKIDATYIAKSDDNTISLIKLNEKQDVNVRYLSQYYPKIGESIHVSGLSLISEFGFDFDYKKAKFDFKDKTTKITMIPDEKKDDTAIWYNDTGNFSGGNAIDACGNIIALQYGRYKNNTTAISSRKIIEFLKRNAVKPKVATFCVTSIGFGSQHWWLAALVVAGLLGAVAVFFLLRPQNLSIATMLLALPSARRETIRFAAVGGDQDLKINLARLKRRRKLTIGRDGKCDVVLSAPSVSSRHAQLNYTSRSKQITLEDLNSTNGTYVNGDRIGRIELEDGDEVRFGKAAYEVICDSESLAPGRQRGGTRASRRQNVRSRGRAADRVQNFEAWELIGESRTAGKIALTIRPQVSNQSGQGVQTSWTIGRSARECDFVVDDPSVSRQHAEIRYLAGAGLELRDLGSSNGTFIDGERVGKRYAPLSANVREITLGDLSLTFSTYGGQRA